MRTTIAAAVFAAVLLTAASAYADVCGDVDDSGELSASDALRVLRGAVGLPVNLICEATAESQFSKVRVHGFDLCPDTKFKSSTGEILTVSGTGYSAYVEFPHDSVQWVEVTACGYTDRFNGPFTIPRERMLHVEVLLLDPIWQGYTCDDLVTYITLIDDGPRPGGNP
jgi:hypothetical protein